jgi:hypothetical protein
MSLPVAKAVMMTILRRVGARKAQEERPVPIVLPANKSEFPKLLCLDQNKWIDLARSHYGRDDGARFREALAAVRAATSKGTLVVPIFATNAGEVAEPMDEGRRKRLAQFMVELSENRSVLHHIFLEMMEMRRAVSACFKGDASIPSVRPSLIHWGVTAATRGRADPGISVGNAKASAFINELLSEPEISVGMLVNALGRDTIKATRELDERIRHKFEEVRAEYADGRPDAHDRREHELRNLFASGSVATRLRGVLEKMNVDPAKFHEWLCVPENLHRFGAEVPGIEVPLSLILSRDKSLDNKIHRNDGKDLTFFEVAIPYGNIVVTERSWSHTAAVSGLAAKYDTQVVPDAAALPELLTRAGCL